MGASIVFLRLCFSATIFQTHAAISKTEPIPSEILKERSPNNEKAFNEKGNRCEYHAKENGRGNMMHIAISSVCETIKKSRKLTHVQAIVRLFQLISPLCLLKVTMRNTSGNAIRDPAQKTIRKA